jgi:hypothetical protein
MCIYEIKAIVAPFGFVTVLQKHSKSFNQKGIQKVFTTYPFSDPDPHSKRIQNLSIFRFDGFTDKPIQKEWKVVELENDYIKLIILPEIVESMVRY